ncbi:hypothetical protein PR003_g21775 [Phytophthora rubi]|uniref:Uncharacterized protein n=2 Tax=Phytophthora TaxID=4783 RepID=A0A6A4D9B7_9STRA|nr:hypothetical protein PR003_g21775 [Phytophthora rubi]
MLLGLMLGGDMVLDEDLVPGGGMLLGLMLGGDMLLDEDLVPGRRHAAWLDAGRRHAAGRGLGARAATCCWTRTWCPGGDMLLDEDLVPGRRHGAGRGPVPGDSYSTDNADRGGGHYCRGYYREGFAMAGTA